MTEIKARTRPAMHFIRETRPLWTGSFANVIGRQFSPATEVPLSPCNLATSPNRSEVS
jgi:hypothetical protein